MLEISNLKHNHQNVSKFYIELQQRFFDNKLAFAASKTCLSEINLI